MMESSRRRFDLVVALHCDLFAAVVGCAPGCPHVGFWCPSGHDRDREARSLIPHTAHKRAQFSYADAADRSEIIEAPIEHRIRAA